MVIWMDRGLRTKLASQDFDGTIADDLPRNRNQ